MSSLQFIVSFLLSGVLNAPSAQAAYANYSSVLLGDRAAGMGGAYTALSSDPAATPFYNPATTILQEGSSFSGAVSVYNKYETTIGSGADFTGGATRFNRGFFRAIPASSGTILNYRKFAIGFSILSPDYDYYNGEIQTDTNKTSSLNFIDQSLWAGGTFSIRLSDFDSAGVSIYYTARTYQRSVNDRTGAGTSAAVTSEDMNLTSNNLVAILGYHRALGEQWSMGLSVRPPSVQIYGEGTFYRSSVVVSPFSDTEIYHGSTKAVTRIPMKFAIGLAREVRGESALSFDATFYGAENYQDLPETPDATDDVHHRLTANFALGYERSIRPWLAARTGLFTNLSSAASPSDTSGTRQLDQINMYGWSANISIKPHEQTSFTFGGYYSAGSGLSTQFVGNAVRVTPKSQQIFTMLVGTGFHF